MDVVSQVLVPYDLGWSRNSDHGLEFWISPLRGDVRCMPPFIKPYFTFEGRLVDQ